MKAIKYPDSKKQQPDFHEFQDWMRGRLARVNKLGHIQHGGLEDIKDESYYLKRAAKFLDYLIEWRESEPNREQQIPNTNFNDHEAAIKAQCYRQQALIDSLDGILDDCDSCYLGLYSKESIKPYEALRDMAKNNLQFLGQHKQDVIEMLEAEESEINAFITRGD